MLAPAGDRDVSRAMIALKVGGLAVVSIIVCTACGERQEVSYANLVSAERAGAIHAGWIPDWLPKSAADLREVHNLNTNQSMLSFRYDPGDRLTVPTTCSHLSGSSEIPPVPFNVSWWPNDVPPRMRFATPRPIAFFSCEGGRAFLAVLPGEAHYWRP